MGHPVIFMICDCFLIQTHAKYPLLINSDMSADFNRPRRAAPSAYFVRTDMVPVIDKAPLPPVLATYVLIVSYFFITLRSISFDISIHMCLIQ